MRSIRQGRPEALPCAPRRRVLIGLAALVMGCGGAPPKPAEALPIEPPRPRNAAAIAQSIAGGKVSALVYAERAQGHPLTARLAALGLWQPLLEGTGLDPTRDLARVFVSAPRVDAGRDAVTVLEHKVPPDKLDAAIQALIARSEPPGAMLDDLGVPAARVTLRGQTRVIARVEPTFLVVLPEAKAREAMRFVGTGGFPDPKGDEAAVAMAIDPARTLKAPRAPPVPETVRALEATVTLAADGGADLALDGASTSPEQAAADAAALSEGVERATTLRISIVKLRVVDPIPFFAEGEHVKAKRHVSPEELDKLLGLLNAVLPR